MGADMPGRDTEGLRMDPDSSSEFQLPTADALGARRAREFARDWCRRHQVDGLTDDVLVVVTELVQNATVHGRGPVRLRLSGGGRSVRAEVSDRSSRPPTPQVPTVGDDHGRGLQIVAALSARWGTDEASGVVGGKVVWAEISSP